MRRGRFRRERRLRGFRLQAHPAAGAIGGVFGQARPAILTIHTLYSHKRQSRKRHPRPLAHRLAEGEQADDHEDDADEHQQKVDDEADRGSPAAGTGAQRRIVLPHQIEDEPDDGKQKAQKGVAEARPVARVGDVLPLHDLHGRLGDVLLLHDLHGQFALRLSAAGADVCAFLQHTSAIFTEHMPPPPLCRGDDGQAHGGVDDAAHGDHGQDPKDDVDHDADERALAARMRALGQFVFPHQIEDEPYQGEEEAEHRKAAAGGIPRVGLVAAVPLLLRHAVFYLFLKAFAAVRTKS